MLSRQTIVKGNSLYFLRKLLVLFTFIGAWLIQCQQGKGTASCKNKQRTFTLKTLDMYLNYICFIDLTLY